MSKIYLIRHGETDWNAKGVIQGNSDVSLSSDGMQEITALVKSFPPVSIDTTLLISSDLTRCKTTAYIIADDIGLLPQFTKLLREVDFGYWTGRNISDLRNDKIEQDAWDEMQIDHRWGGGEFFSDAFYRVYKCIADYIRKNPEKDLIVITHGLIIQLLASFWMFDTLERSKCLHISNGSMTILEFNKGIFVKLMGLNITPYKILQRHSMMQQKVNTSRSIVDN